MKFFSFLFLTAAFAPFLAFGGERPQSTTQCVVSPFPPRVEEASGYRVKIGSIRKIAQGVRSPLATGFRDGQILLCTGSAAAGTTMIRSLDHGNTWARQKDPVGHLNTIELQDGSLLAIDYRTQPVKDAKGSYTLKRWISNDQGRTLPEAPDGKLFLPPDTFDPARTHWFHGNLVQLSSGDLITIMQGEELVDGKAAWRTFLVRSVDQGLSWTYVSMLVDHASLAPIRETLTKTGWRLHGSVEPNLLAIDEKHLLCAIRVMDDESDIPVEQFSQPSQTYHDLFTTISGDGMYPGLAKLPADKYYQPGALSCPLILVRSTDGGVTWSRPEAMHPARGCFPRFARGDGVIALSYGGGAGALRWGNFVCFSFDNGKTWTDEVITGPFLSTGYTSIVNIGPKKFVVFFDCTPPQPWTDPRAHWVGAVDLEVITNHAEETKP